MEREPRLRLSSGRPGQPRTSNPSSPQNAPAVPLPKMRDVADVLALRGREIRLRRRIDGLVAQRNEAWRRQRRLEDEIRLAALEPSARELVLQARVDHLNRRVIALHEELREARRVA